MQRRRFLQMTGALAALGSLQPVLAATTTPYIPPVPADTGAQGTLIVIGGGMAGATAAKYLRLWGGQKVKVVLIDSSPYYLSNILSNFVLTGTRSLTSLTYQWNLLKSRYGVQVINQRVTAIKPNSSGVGGKVVVGTSELAYTRLVVAPGIEFDPVPGVPADLQGYYPHAWQAGPQTTELRRQLVNLPAGGTVLMSIPAAPYRCPPGPYERACLIADWLKRNKRGAKLIVLDANAGITAEKETFTKAFTQLYQGVLEYYPSLMIASVNGRSGGGGTVNTLQTHPDANGSMVPGSAGPSFGPINVISPITPQRAGAILTSVPGLLQGRWAPVNVLSYESRIPGIHVIGDASQTTQPKAGHIANQEAKVCTDAIVRLLRGETPDPAPVTNSACFSPITATQASWLTAVFQYDPATGTMKKYLRPAGSTAAGVLADGEAGTWNSENFEQMGRWFKQLMADTYA